MNIFDTLWVIATFALGVVGGHYVAGTAGAWVGFAVAVGVFVVLTLLDRKRGGNP